MPSRWTQWWWLRLQSASTWSADERRAAGAVYGTLLVCFLVTVPAFAFYISRLQFDPNVTAIAAIAASLLAVVPNVRVMASKIFPAIIRKGDEAAAKRVADVVVLPEENPGLWWINYGAGTNQISSEEQFVRVAIFIAAMLIFAPSAIYLPPHLMNLFDLTKRTSILVTMTMLLPLSYFVGRKLIAALWSDVTRKADENAWARLKGRQRIRQDDLPARKRQAQVSMQLEKLIDEMPYLTWVAIQLLGLFFTLTIVGGLRYGIEPFFFFRGFGLFCFHLGCLFSFVVLFERSSVFKQKA